MKYILALENAFIKLSPVEVYSSREKAEARIQEIIHSFSFKKIHRNNDLVKITTNVGSILNLKIYETDAIDYYVSTTVLDIINGRYSYQAYTVFSRTDPDGLISYEVSISAEANDENNTLPTIYYDFDTKESAEQFISKYVNWIKRDKSQIIEKYGAYYFERTDGEWDCCSCGIASTGHAGYYIRETERYYEYDIIELLGIYLKKAKEHKDKLPLMGKALLGHLEMRSYKCDILSHEAETKYDLSNGKIRVKLLPPTCSFYDDKKTNLLVTLRPESFKKHLTRISTEQHTNNT